MTKKKAKEEIKDIPVKNYLVLGTIIIITFLACIYLFAWFRQYNDQKINTPVITNALREVEGKEKFFKTEKETKIVGQIN